jgi:hypothetical protein
MVVELGWCVAQSLGWDKHAPAGGKWLQSVQHPAHEDEPALYELEDFAGMGRAVETPCYACCRMCHRVRLLLCCLLSPLTAVCVLTTALLDSAGLALDSSVEVSTSHAAVGAPASLLSVSDGQDAACSEFLYLCSHMFLMFIQRPDRADCAAAFSTPFKHCTSPAVHSKHGSRHFGCALVCGFSVWCFGVAALFTRQLTIAKYFFVQARHLGLDKTPSAQMCPDDWVVIQCSGGWCVENTLHSIA